MGPNQLAELRFAHKLHPTPVNTGAVELAGVPQIPRDVHETITKLGEWALTENQIARAEEAIWIYAAPEIRRRHARKLQRDERYELPSEFEDEGEAA
jgi:hypothetical protein